MVLGSDIMSSEKTVLLVESNINHQAMYKFLLGKALHCATTLVKNEVEAALFLLETCPNLIIIGGSISSESSKELIKFIKKTSNDSSIHILKISSSVNQADVFEYIKLGIDDILLVKEFQPSKFISKVSTLLNKGFIAGKAVASQIMQTTSSTPPQIKQEPKVTISGLTPLKKQEPIIAASAPQASKQQEKVPAQPLSTPLEKDAALIQKATQDEDYLKNCKPLITLSFLEKKLAKIANINTLPFIVSELLSLTSSCSSDINDLVRLIETDYSLTAKVLKLANSAFYKRTNPKTYNLKDAIKVVGFNGVKELVIAVSTVNFLNEGSDSSALNKTKLWYYSFTVGVIAKEFALLMKHPVPESCFVLGLLNNVGLAILSDHFNKEFNELIETCIEHNLPLFKAEKKLIGLKHTEIACTVLKTWGFNDSIYMPISLSHLSLSEILHLDAKYSKYKKDLMLIKLSECLAKILCGGLIDSEIMDEIPEEIFSAANINLKLSKEELLTDIFDIKNTAKELMQIMLLYIEPEIFANCDGYSKYVSFKKYNLMLVQKNQPLISILEIILKGLNFDVNLASSNFHTQFNTSRPDGIIFDIDSDSKDLYTTECIRQFSKDSESGDDISCCIMAPKDIIEVYKQKLGIANKFIYLSKPFTAGNLYSFLETLKTSLK